MKTFLLILIMLAAPLAAQDEQPQDTNQPQTAAKSVSGQVDQQPQTIVKATAEPTQPRITFTAKQLDEYEDKILDRAEGFYDKRMNDLRMTMALLIGFVGGVIPLVVTVIAQWQRKISFKKELTDQTREFEEKLSSAEATFLKRTKEQTGRLKEDLIRQNNDLEKAISLSFYMAFSGLGGLFLPQDTLAVDSLTRQSAGINLSLQSHILALKYSIIAQYTGGVPATDQIIFTFSQEHAARSLGLGTLKIVDRELEDMKRELDKITDDEKQEFRKDMESQVKDLQIFVHSLISEKRQEGEATPPSSGPQSP